MGVEVLLDLEFLVVPEQANLGGGVLSVHGWRLTGTGKIVLASLVGCGSPWWGLGVNLANTRWDVGVRGGVWDSLVGRGSKSYLELSVR